MARDTSKLPEDDKWLEESGDPYKTTLSEDEVARRLRLAWAEGFEAGGEEEAQRRMEEKYRELNLPEPTGE